MATSITNVTIAVLGVVSSVWCARLLGPERRGELAAIQTIPMWLSWLLIGMPDALAYFSAREPTRARQWVATTMLIGGVSCLPLLVIGIIILPLLLQEQSAETIQAAKLYLLFIMPIGVIVNLPVFALIGLNDSVFYNLMRLLWPLLWIVSITIIWGVKSSDPVQLSQVYLVLMWLLIPVIIYVVRHRVPGNYQPDLSKIKPAIAYGFSAALSNVPVTMNLKLDQMIMPGFLPSHMLGLYVVGVAWSNTFSPLILALSTSIVPRVAGETREEKQIQLVAQTIRFSSGFALLMAGCVALLAPLAIPLLFGNEYSSIIQPAIVLALASAPAGMNHILAANAKSLGKPKMIIIAEGGGMIATAVLLWLLLNPWQLMGAAVASLGSYIITTIIFIWLFRRHTLLGVRQLLLPTSGDWDILLHRLITITSIIKNTRATSRNSKLT